MGNFCIRHIELQQQGVCVDGDRITLVDQRNRAAHSRFGGHVADHHAPGAAREAAIGYQAHALAESRANQRASGRQHFGHARAAFGAKVAQNHHVARDDLAVQNRFEGGLLVVKHTGRACHHWFFQAGDLGHAAFRRQVALQNRQMALCVHRVADGADHVLISTRCIGDVGQHFDNSLAGNREAVAVQQPGHQQSFHDLRDTACAMQVYGQVFAAGLEVAQHRRFDGVGGVHAAAGAGAGDGALLDFVQIKVAQIAGCVLAHGFEDADDIEILALVATRQDGAAVDVNCRYVSAQHAHQAAGHVFVAAADDHHAVHPLALHAGLDAVGNHFAADQRVLHAFGAHGHAVRDGGRAKHLGIAAGLLNAGDGRVGQLLQAAVAGGNRAVSVGHADHGFLEIRLFIAHGVVHGPVRRAGLALGDIGAAAVDGQDGDGFVGHGASPIGW